MALSPKPDQQFPKRRTITKQSVDNPKLKKVGVRR